MKKSEYITEHYSIYKTQNLLAKKIFERFRKQLSYFIRISRVHSILDVGCGPGYMMQYLKNVKPDLRFTGIDNREDVIIEAKKNNPLCSFRKADIQKLPFESSSFDLVMCIEVLEHLKDYQKAINEIKRVSDKYCLISVPNEPVFRIANLFRGKNVFRLGNDPEHLQNWTKKDFKMLLKKNFKNVTIKNNFSLEYCVV